MTIRNQILTSIIPVTSVFFLLSCQKKDDTAPQPAKVNIVVSSPKALAAYKKGDTVFISAAVSYVSQLHGYNIHITDKTTNKLVGDLEGHVHNDHFDVSEYWVDTVGQSTSLKVEISAVIDHDGNESTADVEIQSQP